jgi:hypothetical protein
MEGRKAHRILVGKPEGNRPPGRHVHRWENNIQMDLKETGWGGTDWIDPAQNIGPVEGSCEHGNETSGSIKCWEVLE